MKKVRSLLGFVMLVAVSVSLFTGCSDDDEDSSKNTEIFGNWKITSLATDSEKLNSLLPLMLSGGGIDLYNSTVVFNSDSNVKLTIPATGGAIEEETKYNFNGTQLALSIKILDGLGINAFDVPSYTEQVIVLSRHLTKTELKLLITLVKASDATMGATLEALLESVMESGVTLTINLTKVSELS